LDFPYVVLPDATGATRTGAAGFLRVLLTQAAQQILASAGFRTPDGRAPAGVPPSTGIRGEAMAPVPLPDDDMLVELLSTWTGVHLSARILGVIDISGSMGEPIPGTGDTRLSATIKAAQQGVGLLLDSTQVSVWVFSTQLDAGRDYRIVVRYQPLAEGGRASLVAQLGQVRVKPGGRTALYNTTLAAYQEARRRWTPGQINVILIATDGGDDNASGITHVQLVTELGKLQDPRRPLPILFIGLSGGVDPRPLQDIAAVTGGKVYIAKDPSGIRQIFFDALGDLACQPPLCRR
jgi:von Willebrand factor type A domain